MFNDRDIEIEMLNLWNKLNNSKLKTNENLRQFMFEHIFCNEKFVCNENYTYILKNKFGSFQSKTKGIYLFHSICKNAQMSSLFVKLINEISNYNNTKNDLEHEQLSTMFNKTLRTFDRTNKLPLQHLVFGYYNRKYQSIKYSKQHGKKRKRKINNKNDEDISSVVVGHRMDRKSNDNDNDDEHEKLLVEKLHSVQYKTNYLCLNQLS